MKLKVGDKLLCKKDCFTLPGGSDKKTKKTFYKGESYIIRDMDVGFEGDNENFYSMIFGPIELNIHNYSLWFTDRKLNVNYCYIWEYFCTEKELRKLKLERIESGR